MISLSLGSIGQHIIATSSWIILTKIMSKFGTPVVAGYTIAIRVILFVLLPIWGMSNAAATLVGQNLGAQRPDRAEKSVWITGLVCAGIMGLTSLAFILFPAVFIGLLTGDPEVIHNGAGALRILSYGFVFFGGGMVLVQALNGSGDTRTPTWINLICFWILELPLACVTAVLLGIGETAVFYSIVCADIMMTGMAYYYFKLGRWKLTEL